MAQTLANLVVELEANSAKLTSGLKKAEAATKSSSSRINRGLASIDRRMKSLDRTAAGVAARFLSLAAAGLALRSLVKTASSFEQLRIQLETVTGSADAATEAFDRIKAFAISTPFEVENITEAFIRLKAVGLEPTERRMRAFADASAAFGKDITDFAGAVIGAVTGETERLKAFGIVAKLEQDKVRLLFKGTERVIRRDAESITDALTELAEVNFAGGAERQVNSLAGAFSNLQDALAAFFDEIGQSGGLFVLTAVTKELTLWAEALTRIPAATRAAFAINEIKGVREEIAEVVNEISRLEKLNAVVPVIGTPEAIAIQTEKLDELTQKLRELVGLTDKPIEIVVNPGGRGVDLGKQADAQLKDFNRELDRMRQMALAIVEETRTPFEEFQARIAELNRTVGPDGPDGSRNWVAYGRAVAAAQEELDEANNRIAEAAAETKQLAFEQSEAGKRAEELASIGDAAGSRLASGFTDAALEGRKLGDVIQSLIHDMARMLFQAALLRAAGVIFGAGTGGSVTGGGDLGQGPGTGAGGGKGSVGVGSANISAVQGNLASSGGNVTINNNTGTEVEASNVSRSPNGDIEVTLDRAMARAALSGGAFTQALGQAGRTTQR